MASSPRGTAAANDSSAGTARGSSTGIPPCRDLPAGKVSISASAAGEFDEGRPHDHSDAGISTSISAGGAASVPPSAAIADEGSLPLDAIEASHREERALLSSSKG